MMRGERKNAPARQRGGVYGVQANEDVRRDCRAAGPRPQLLTDSRSRVVAAVRAVETRDLPLFALSASKAAELRRIAATTYAHRERLLKALQACEITAGDAFTYLDTQQPHARLCALRDEGVAIFDRWVLVRTGNGHTRRVKAYRMVKETDTKQ